MTFCIFVKKKAAYISNMAPYKNLSRHAYNADIFLMEPETFDNFSLGWFG